MSQRRKAGRLPGLPVAPEAQEGVARRVGHGHPPPDKLATAVLAAAIVLVFAVSTLLKLFASGHELQEPTAVIVDQLSLTQPNPDFVETAARTLEQAGYAVDYYPGEQVTVDFYRTLPLHDYDLVVLRVHFGVGADTASVSLFTSEPYSLTSYVAEQRAGRFGRARYYEGSEVYFGIHPAFVASSMRGRFDQAIVIMMGCWGLAWPDMAEALVQRGAKTVVSWDGLVSAAHTDEATEHLLRDLVVEGLTVPEAVAQTTDEVGPDPTYGSNLLFYPPESGGLQEPYLPP